MFFRFSSGGTKSVLHTDHDSYENLHCLVSGLKEFVLIPPEFSDVIGPEHAELGYYCIDVEKYVLVVMVTRYKDNCCYGQNDITSRNDEGTMVLCESETRELFLSPL